ncbi:MAG: PepSY domain-containing protein, partial [Planctomycetota bacterium]
MKTLPLLLLGALGALLFQAVPPKAAAPTSRDWQEALDATHVPLARAVATARKQTGGRVVSARLETRRSGKGIQTVYRLVARAQGHLQAVEIGTAKGGISRIESGFDFENDAPGKIPRGWTPGETNGAGTPGTWKVESVADAASGDKVMSLARTSNAGST